MKNGQGGGIRCFFGKMGKNKKVIFWLPPPPKIQKFIFAPDFKLDQNGSNKMSAESPCPPEYEYVKNFRKKSIFKI
jgi:hypothetical protein